MGCRKSTEDTKTITVTGSKPPPRERSDVIIFQPNSRTPVNSPPHIPSSIARLQLSSRGSITLSVEAGQGLAAGDDVDDENVGIDGPPLGDVTEQTVDVQHEQRF